MMPQAQVAAVLEASDLTHSDSDGEELVLTGDGVELRFVAA